MTRTQGLALMGGIFVLIFVVSYLRRKRRTQALEAVAAEMGLSFVAEKPNFLGDLQLPITLLPSGRVNPRARNFMEGTMSGMRTAIFDFLREDPGVTNRADDTNPTKVNTVLQDMSQIAIALFKGAGVSDTAAA